MESVVLVIVIVTGIIVPRPTTTPPPCSSNGSTCYIDLNCCSNYCADGICANRPVASPTPACDMDNNGVCNTPDPYCIYECETSCDAGQIYKEKTIYCRTRINCPFCSTQRNVSAPTQCGLCSSTTPIPTDCQPYACYDMGDSRCQVSFPSCSGGVGYCDNCGGVDCGWCGGEEPPSGPTPTPGCTENCMSDPRYLTTCYNDTFGICANSRWCYGQLEPIAPTAPTCSNLGTVTSMPVTISWSGPVLLVSLLLSVSLALSSYRTF